MTRPRTDEDYDRALIELVRRDWSARSQDSRPDRVWIARHETIAVTANSIQTTAVRAWILDAAGVHPRTGSEFVRFTLVQWGKYWNAAVWTSRPPPAILYSKSNRGHEIGLANFAPTTDPGVYYFECILGGGCAAGDHYQFNEYGSLECVRRIWIS